MARRARMRPSLKTRLTVMPASASAAAITSSSICNDAVGFAVDAVRSGERNPRWLQGWLLQGWLLHRLGVLLLVGGRIGDGGGTDIGRVA